MNNRNLAAGEKVGVNLRFLLITGADAKSGNPDGSRMGSLWPFKKKAAEPEGQKIVTYSKDDDHAEEIMTDRSHIEGDQYQAAIDLLTKPHLGDEESGEIAASEVFGTEQNEGPVDLIAIASEVAPAVEDDSLDTASEESASDDTVSNDADSVSEDAGDGDYEQSEDGYWYLKKADGSFEATAYVKSDDGDFSPYE